MALTEGNSGMDATMLVQADGYSYHGNMVDELKRLMDNAPDEKTRQEFYHFIQRMESM